MSRKRFIVSLANDKNSRCLSSEQWQIAFTITPTELSGSYKLFDTVHPIIWGVYNCVYEQPQNFDCDLTMAVSTMKKEADNCVVPVLSRVVPPGHYTALTKQSHMAVWCDVARWREDRPTTVVVTNDAGFEQAFAICLVSDEKHSYDLKFAPIILFNRIPHGRHLQVKMSFRLEAYCGRGLRDMKQVHENELNPIRDESGNPWSVDLDDLQPISSFCVYRTDSGHVAMRTEESQANTANKELLQEVYQLKRKIGDFEKHVTQALGSDFLAVKRLKTQVLEIDEKAAMMQAELDGTNGRVDGFGKEVEDMDRKIKNCLDSISRIRVPPSTRKELSSRMEDVASTVQDMSRLHDSIKLMEEKMQGLGDSLQGLPKLQQNVGQLTTKVHTVSSDMATMNTTVDVMNKRIISVADDTKAKMSSVEQTIGTVQEAFGGVKDEMNHVSGHLQHLAIQVQGKASTDDLKRVQEDVSAAVKRVRGVEGEAVGIQDKLNKFSGSMERVEGSVTVVQGNVKELASKIEGMKASQNTIQVERRLGEVSGRVRKIEDSVQQLEAARRSTPTPDKAELKALRDKIGDVDLLARDAHTKSAGLQGDVHKVKGDVGLVRQYVTALESNVRAVEGGLKAVDVSVQNLEKEFKGMGLKSIVKNYWR